MPFTPFHFGPNALAAVPFGRRFDLPSILLVNIAMDIEPFVVMGMGLDAPVHGASHSFTAGSLIALVFSALFYPFRRSAGFVRVALSSLLGAWLHVLLDGFLYPEMRLLWPFGGNPLFNLVPSDAVYGFCAAAFLPAGWLYWRARRGPKGNA